MGDIKVFRVGNKGATEIEGHFVGLEKSLQTLIENNLLTFFGVRFLASEYSTGATHKGRIDTLGLDENGCPVIIEYKRSLNENVINQGLYYLTWLLDHKAEFTLLTMERYGKDVADNIEWTSPRLLCIAGDFTKFDEHAVQQINRNIELIRYRRYGDDLLLFELVNAVSSDVAPAAKTSGTSPNTGGTVSDYLSQANTQLTDLFEELKAFLLALGDDIQFKVLKNYFAFKKIKNFACIEVHPSANKILAFVKVNPDTIELKEGFTRDMRKIGHFGTGDLEITIRTKDDLEWAKPLFVQSYEAN